jgi:hypothetical protein
MATRTSVKNLVWEMVSGGFTKARAQREVEMEKISHPNHYVKMKRLSVGYWVIMMARKPHIGKNQNAASKIGGVSGSSYQRSKRDSWFIRGNHGKGY